MPGSGAPVAKTWVVLDFNTDSSWYHTSDIFSNVHLDQHTWVQKSGDEVETFQVLRGDVTFKKARRGHVLHLEERGTAVFQQKNLVPRIRLHGKQKSEAHRRCTQPEGEGDCPAALDAIAPLAATSSSMFEFIRILGEGSFASVWIAKRRGSEECVALKMAKTCYPGERAAAAAAIMREFRNIIELQIVATDGIVRAEQMLVSWVPFEAVMVLELCTNSLDNVLRQCQFVPDSPADRCLQATSLTPREAVTQIVKAVAAMHAGRLLHRDLKPGNMLLRQVAHERTAMSIVLSDFGDALHSAAAPEDSQLVGTALYRAPEVYMGGHHTYQSDLWSIGLGLSQMLHNDLSLPNCAQAVWWANWLDGLQFIQANGQAL